MGGCDCPYPEGTQPTRLQQAENFYISLTIKQITQLRKESFNPDKIKILVLLFFSNVCSLYIECKNDLSIKIKQ